MKDYESRDHVAVNEDEILKMHKEVKKNTVASFLNKVNNRPDNVSHKKIVEDVLFDKEALRKQRVRSAMRFRPMASQSCAS
jgi:hypothetical protein